MPAETRYTRCARVEAVTLLQPTVNLIGGPETDELDACVAEADGQQVPAIVFDLSEVEFSNTVGLQVIVGAYLKLIRRGGAVFVFGLRPRVRHLFDVVRLDQLVRRFETREEALAACVSSGPPPPAAR